MAETKTFSIKFDGEGLADHTIEVNDLAPSLMALGDLIKEANYIANGNRTSVSVKVKATEAGCFQVSIEATQTILDQTIALLAGQQVTALANLLQILGFCGISTATVLVLIKKLKRRKSLKVTITENGVVIETDSGVVTVSKLAWQMYNSPVVRKAFFGVVKPVERQGIERVDFIDVETTVSEVTKEELQLFVPPEQLEEPLQVLPDRTTFVNVVHMWFKDGNKWKFSEGGSEWSAEIKDQKFIESLLRGDVSILANDYLKVKVRQSQYRTEHQIRSDYEIIEVIEHGKGYQQAPLL